jgi:hypothetical protein
MAFLRTAEVLLQLGAEEIDETDETDETWRDEAADALRRPLDPGGSLVVAVGGKAISMI